MRFTTKTEYGLVCLVYMAKHFGNGHVVTINELAQSENMSVPYIHKIFLSLRTAGIVASHPGRNGGYTLARSPEKIHLKDIIDALEGGTFEVFCEPHVRKEIVCTHFTLCSISPIWAKTKEMLDSYYASITLKMMAGNGAAETVPAGDGGKTL